MSRILVMALFCLASFSASAAETGSVLRASELREKPFSDAAKVADVAEQTAVEVLDRKGAWMRVKLAGGQSGWLKMLNVRLGSGEIKAGSTASGILGTVKLLATGSSGTTVTTGSKGLSPEQIRAAEPNLAELEKLGKYASTNDAAVQHARRAGLKATPEIAYLAKPALVAAEPASKPAKE